MPSVSIRVASLPATRRSSTRRSASRPRRGRTNRKLLVWTAAAASGGFACGYNLGVISGALLPLRRDLGLSSMEQGALVALLPLGALVGGLLAARLADSVGRRRTLLLDAVLFLVATGLAAVAPGYALLLGSRGLAGVAVGVASTVVPVYIAEIAPAEMRGRLVGVNQLMLTLGILSAYCVDLAFVGSGRWHAMFAVGLVPAAALLVGMLRAPDTTARRERVRTRELTRPAARSALAIGLTLAAIQQLSGINAVLSFAPSIMEKAGLAASSSLVYAVILGGVNVVATVLSIPLVDRAGRRTLLLVSLAGLFVTLTLLGLAFDLGLDSRISLACLVGYVVAFAVGLGPVFWVLIGEIFPQRARAAGASVATAANWFWNFAVGFSFLPLASAIGQPATFWIYAAACLGGLVFVYRRVPETKGRRLEEIEAQIAA